MKNTSPKLNINDFTDKSLLIVDDDDPFRNRLGRAMEGKGFKVSLAKGVEEQAGQRGRTDSLRRSKVCKSPQLSF